MYILCNLSFEPKICFHYLADYSINRIFGRSVFVFLCVQSADADCSFFAMHNTVLDIKCYPNDFLDTFARTQWLGEFDNAEIRAD